MIRTFCYLFIALCWAPLLAGLNSFTILDQPPNVIITQAPSYSQASLSPSEAYKNFQHNHFQPLPKQTRSFGFSDEPIWIGIEIQNGGSQKLFLNLANLSLDHIEYFIYQKGELLQQGISGAAIPIQERDIKKFDLHIPILEINEPLVYLFKIQSHNSIIVPLVLGTEAALHYFVLPEIITVSIFAGAFLALFLYNCILFLVTRKYDYLLYSLYIFCLFCLIISMRDYFSLLLQNHLYLREILKLLSMQIGSLFLILFALNFLNIKSLSPSVYRYTLRIAVVIFLLFGTMPLGAWGHYVAVGALICTMFTSLGLGVFAKFHHNPLANYFLISNATFFIGGSITICMIIGVINYSFATSMALLIGSMLEMILFSLALGYKIRHLSLEHAKALTQLQTQNKILFLQSRYTSVGELIRNITHQWKEPLGAIGAIQTNLKSTLVFQGSVSNEKLLNAIELSHGIINHLASTIDTFYRFFKYKTDKKEEFNIVEEIKNIKKIIKYSMDTDHIELVFEAQNTMIILGNKNEFAHALLNIIINSKEVLVARNIINPTIVIQTYYIDNTNIIEIKDNAGGIFEQPLEKIFEPCISSKAEGIGIGLFITKTIVEKKLGGMLSVKNSDTGAVFKISLPHESTEATENIDAMDEISEPALHRITRLERELSIKNEIEKTLQQWENIFAQAHWAISLHSGISNNFEMVNPAFKTMYGYTENEIKSISVPNLFASSNFDVLEKNQKEAFEKGFVSFEALHVKKDGTQFPVSIDLTVIKNEEGQILYHIANIRDITERKATEKNLLLKEFALNKINEAVYLIDKNSMFHYVNEGACRALGYSKEELSTMGIVDIDPNNPIAYWKSQGKDIKKLGATIGISQHRRKDGTLFSIEISSNYFEYDGAEYSLAITRDISERILSEEKKDNERMRLFFEKQLVGMAITTPDKKWLNVNDKLCDMLGYTKEELRNLTWEALTYPDENLIYDNAQFERVLAGEIDFYALKKHYIHKDGHLILANLLIQCVRSHSGDVKYFLSHIEDITEKTRSHETLVAREKELSLLANSSPGMVGSFCLRPDGSIYMPYVSPNIEELFGLLPADMKKDAMPLMALNHPDDAQRIIESIAKSAEEMSIWHEEYRINHPHKGERWMESHTKPERQPNGDIVWYGYVHDITERKQMEKELADSYHFLNHLIDSIPDSIFVKDRQHNWILLNEAFCKLLDKPRNELLGKSDYDFFTKEEADIFWEKDEIVFETCEINVNEEFFTTHHGNTYYMQTVKSMFEIVGKGKYLVGIIHDISQRKKVEDTIKELNFTLEEQVRKRTLQLQNALEFNEGIINAIPDLLFEIDEKGNYLNVWAQNEQLLAAQKETLLTRNVRDILSFEAATMTTHALSEASLKGFSFGHVICIDFSKEKRWFELSISKKISSNTFLVLSRDITDRNNTEKQLKLLETAINKADNAIYIITHNSTIVYANDTASRMLGYEQQEFVGMKIRDIDPFLKNEQMDAMAKEKEIGKTVTFETKHQTKEGYILDVHVTATYFKFEETHFGISLVKKITKGKGLPNL